MSFVYYFAVPKGRLTVTHYCLLGAQKWAKMGCRRAGLLKFRVKGSIFFVFFFCVHQNFIVFTCLSCSVFHGSSVFFILAHHDHWAGPSPLCTLSGTNVGQDFFSLFSVMVTDQSTLLNQSGACRLGRSSALLAKRHIFPRGRPVLQKYGHFSGHLPCVYFVHFFHSMSWEVFLPKDRLISPTTDLCRGGGAPDTGLAIGGGAVEHR